MVSPVTTCESLLLSPEDKPFYRPPPLPPRRWTSYIQFLLTVLYLAVPFLSLLYLHATLYYSRKSWSPFKWALPLHLIILCLVIFLAGSSFLVILARDPGTVLLPREGEELEEGERGITVALLRSDSSSVPSEKWCGECNVPKPPRAYHCSECSRCVLKMDHHSTIISRCIGHRTYGPFAHLVLSSTLVSLSTFIMSIPSVHFLFNAPAQAAHVFAVVFTLTIPAGIGFVLVISSLLCVSLISKNQTDTETSRHSRNFHPRYLLPYLPPPFTTRKYHDLLQPQRRALRELYTMKTLRIWDLGRKRNWSEVFGGGEWWDIIWWGGRPKGDGLNFEMRPGVEEEPEEVGRKLEELGRMG